MKKLLLILLGTLISLPALSRDFEYTYEGQTLTYTVIDEAAKKCKTKDGIWYNPGNYVSGELIIPSKAKDGNVEYAVIEIGRYAFCYCDNLTSVEIPNSLTSIGNYAFEGCSGLTSIEIPNSITSIGGAAFAWCSVLTSVEIPKSTTSIGGAAFGHCNGLTSIKVSPGNPNYASVDGVLFNKRLSTLIKCPGGRTGDYKIPTSVVSISTSAFEDCSGLTSVDIPTSVTSIGDEAFCYCSGLTSVTIPNSVTSIGNYAFEYCSGLTSIEIPTSITSIGGGTFWHCSSLTSVEIPNSVTSIDNQAFSSCSNLTSIEVSPENPNYASVDGVLFNKELSALIQFPGGRTGNYVIPNSVTIGVCAFEGCSGLTSVEIPNSVTFIDDCPFFGCSGLTSIEVSPENPNYASVDGVLFNKDLSTLIQFPGGRTGDYKIPNSVTSVGGWAFYGCSSLTSVEIPNSVTSIGSCAFYGCSNLTSVEIPNSVTSINDYAFYGCSGLILVTIPNSVTSVGGWAFYGCSSLTSVEIPNSVTSIGSCTFYGCSNLTSVEISNSVTSIGYWPFVGCSGLTSIYYTADEPIECYSSIFDRSTYESATLYMSEKGIVKGRTIDPWKNFAKIDVYDPTDGIDAIDADIDFNQTCEVYSLSGAKVGDNIENLAPGTYIIRQGNAVKKIAVK